MFTKLATIEQYKGMFVEMLLNRTDRVTKVTETGVMNGVSFGVAKLAQKINKDIAVLEGHIFPDTAVGQMLDDISQLEGVSPRFGSKQSSTYVLIVADPGTTYTPGVNTFYSTSNIPFDLESVCIISNFGYGYAKVRSRTTGSAANVNCLSLNKVTPEPIGHKYVINEYIAQFGADREIDDIFRKRIKEGVDLLSKSTISQIEQVFMKSNQNVLKVYYGGIDDFGRVVLNILTENGIDLNQSEINDILLRSEKYFSITEFRPSNFNGYGVTLKNVEWQTLDISMRVDVDQSYNIDDVRRDMQIRMGKFLDYRYWKPGSLLSWSDLLDIAKTTNGIRYVSDSYFYPSADIQTDVFKLPRIRGFQMLDLNGNILQDFNGNLNPIYYPQEVDFSFRASVLQNI